MQEYSHQFTREEEHQKELKSAKTEFIKEDREKMRDPEPCRIKHTEDTEQQTGWSLFFSYQLGPIIERSTNTCKHIRDQNRTNADLMTLLLL